MKKTFCFLSLSFLLVQCKNSIKNENAEVTQETGTIAHDTPTIVNTATEIIHPDTFPKGGNIYGFWVGYFEKDLEERNEDNVDLYVDEGYVWQRENKINISIDSIHEGIIHGHSVVAGNSRPFTGSIDSSPGGGFSFQVKEPGDNKYDGIFNFEIKDSVLAGKWTAFKKIEIPKRKYQLKKMKFEYDPNRMLEHRKPFVNWEKSGKNMSEEMEEFSATFASATDQIYKINASNKLLTKEEVENLKKGDLLIIRNMIYARHGYSFKGRPLRVFFDAQSWYIPVYADIKNDFTEIEKKNIQLLLRYEKNAKEYYDYFGRG